MKKYWTIAIYLTEDNTFNITSLEIDSDEFSGGFSGGTTKLSFESLYYTHQEISEILNRAQQKEEMFDLELDGARVLIPYSQILYVELFPETTSEIVQEAERYINAPRKDEGTN